MIKILYATLAGLAAGILIVGAMLLKAQDDKLVYEVQTGQKALWCQMPDGYRQIEPEKITGFDGMEWKFKNGSAKSCKIV